MQQRQRLKNLDRFKAAVQVCDVVELGAKEVTDFNERGNGAVLVCTDVAARGLDIPNVKNVLHYQSPFNAEIYVHRSGRTARIGAQGESLNLLAPDDEKNFRLICSVLKKPTERVEMLEVKYSQLELMKPVVDGATTLEKTEHRQS